MKGKFVVLEGIDGSGKSSIIEFITGQKLRAFNLESASHQIQKKLLDNFKGITVSYEPTDSSFGRQIRQVLKKVTEVSKEELIELFINDRAVNIEYVNKMLSLVMLVVQDRYYYSNVAYQSYSQDDLDSIMSKNMAKFPEPDLLVYLDCPVDVALSRINSRFSQEDGVAAELFDSKKELERVKANYEKVLPRNCLRIDSSNKTTEEICELIVDEILKNTKQSPAADIK